MKRAVCLLLFVLGAWLLASPAARVPELRAQPPGLSASDGRLRDAVEQLAPQSATPHVARAPRFARLPIAPLGLPPRGATFRRQAAHEPVRDLRQALRRVQTRRRVPRLSGGEPPWL
ncbi:MAG TPA: hypothetical protein VNG33_16235 [Polyangiaceae bacterium]|nr:hypothetical protein [Polyangiaceae bacterium]